MDEIEKAKLASAAAECRAHAKRIDAAVKAIVCFFPLSVDAADHMDDDAVAHLDQFIYRFTKLQDTMGTRLLPALYAVLQADSLPKPFLDVLDSLEKIGALTSVSDWQYFRNLRNGFAHEYPDRPEQTVAAMNELYSSWPLFRSMYEVSLKKAESVS